MATIVRLDEAIDAILEALKLVVVAATADGELLEDVATVVIGNSARPRPELPSLWVFGAPATQRQTQSLREDWEMPVDLISIVQGDEPETAMRLASKLASRARTVVLGDRRIGLAFVNDVVSTRFDGARETQIDNRTLYSAAATVTVRFWTYEGT